MRRPRDGGRPQGAPRESHTMTEASASPRTLACEQCGTAFQCDLTGHCWCMDVPVRLPLPGESGGDCLCPDCLRARSDAPAAPRPR